jgi:hypothetical protein
MPGEGGCSLGYAVTTNPFVYADISGCTLAREVPSCMKHVELGTVCRGRTLWFRSAPRLEEVKPKIGEVQVGAAMTVSKRKGYGVLQAMRRCCHGRQPVHLDAEFLVKAMLWRRHAPVAYR